MKKTIALILALLLVLTCLSAALAESSVFPKFVPAESMDVFVGHWDLFALGDVNNNKYYTMEELNAMGIKQEMTLDIEKDKSIVNSKEDGIINLEVNNKLNTEDGSLILSENSGTSISFYLCEDGTICFKQGADGDHPLYLYYAKKVD